MNPNNTTYGMSPIQQVLPVTPGTPYTNSVTARAFMVNVAGNINLTDASGATNILAVLAGQIYWIRNTAVSASGTTATGIFALI